MESDRRQLIKSEHLAQLPNMKTLPAFDDPESKKLIQKICDEHGIDVPLLKNLCEVIQQYSGSGRKHDVDSDIAGYLDGFLARKPEA